MACGSSEGSGADGSDVGPSSEVGAGDGSGDGGTGDGGTGDGGTGDSGSGIDVPSDDASDVAEDSGDVGRGDADTLDADGSDAGPGDAASGDADLVDADVADDASAAGPDSGGEDADDDSGVPEPCTGAARVAFGPDLVPGAGWASLEVAPCTDAATAMVVPRGARWEVQARDLPPDARIFVYGPSFRGREARGELRLDPIARTEFAGESGELAVSFVVPTSGEYVALYDRDAFADAGELSARVVCREGCALETTRYPVVLVHGYAGVDSYFGLLDYFYGIHDPLETAGYDVYAPVTDPIASSERRAGQLAAQVDEILRQTGAAKINIIAHSQGGLDARLLVSGLGYADRVASITTVATPHRGVPAVLWDFFSVQSFDPDEMAEFNARYPDQPEVRYWSWSARTCGVLAFGCQRDSAGEIVDGFLVATHTLLDRFGDNDGIVTTSSMPWGEHLGLLYADHFDEVGQIADGSPSWDAFDHRAFYRSEVRRLAAAGF